MAPKPSHAEQGFGELLRKLSFTPCLEAGHRTRPVEPGVLASVLGVVEQGLHRGSRDHGTTSPVPGMASEQHTFVETGLPRSASAISTCKAAKRNSCLMSCGIRHVRLGSRPRIQTNVRPNKRINSSGAPGSRQNFRKDAQSPGPALLQDRTTRTTEACGILRRPPKPSASQLPCPMP